MRLPLAVRGAPQLTRQRRPSGGRCPITADGNRFGGAEDDLSFTDSYVALLEKLRLSDRETKRLSDEEILLRLRDLGVSRLTGERILALGRGTAELGRARAHMQSRAK